MAGASKDEIVIRPQGSVLDTIIMNLRELPRYKELFLVFVKRDLKIRYRRTVIGIGWVVLQPFISMIIFTIIFGKIAKIPTGDIPYPVFVYAGLLPWQLFSRALTEASMSVVGNAGLITRIYFPRIILPVSVILSALVDFAVAFSILIILMIIYKVGISINILLAPFFVFMLVFCAFSISLWLSAVNVKFRDVKYVLQFLNQIWFFATPIVYPSSLIPEKWRFIAGINPMSSVIEGIRWSLTGGTPPHMGMLIASLLTITAIFVGGIIYFFKMERTFADII